MSLAFKSSESETLATVEELGSASNIFEALTDKEASDRHWLELKVERAFYEAGKALQELRNRRLYRSTHKTFEEYCRERFGFTHRHVNYLIAGSQVVYNLQTGTNSSQILPTSETQVRHLASFEADKQLQIWQEAVERAGGRVPSGRIVKSIVERLKEKHPPHATNSYNVGDAFTLTGLSGSERKYNGCWAIALSVNDFTVEVDVHDAVLIVKPDNLNRIDLPDAQRQIPQIKERIRRLHNCGILDRCAYTVLESLGRQTYLTPVEEKVLSALEEYYAVGS